MMIFEKKTEQRWAEGCVPRHPEMVAIVCIHQTKLMSYSKHKKGAAVTAVKILKFGLLSVESTNT